MADLERPPDRRSQRLGELIDGHLDGSPGLEDLAGDRVLAGVERRDDGGRQVLGIHEVARLLTVAVDPDRVAPERRAKPRGDDALLVEGIRAVRVREPEGAGREAVRRLRRPRGEAVAVAHRDAEHLADDGGGHRQREVGDHVHLAARGHPVEALVDDALDVAAQCGDRPRREGAAHETTETGVRRRILLEHELALPA